MVYIVLEAKSKDTPEAHFIRAVLDCHFPHSKIDVDYKIVYADGKDNLKNLTPMLQSNKEEGAKNVLIFDADSPSNGGGYERRKKELIEARERLGLDFDLFLYPNDEQDGDVEVLMERVAQRDRHRRFFSCFEKYEECISLDKDSNGDTKYSTPNRKGKLHTYISSMKLSSKQRRSIGKGDWLFDNTEYWNLESDALSPLVSFLRKYLQ